LCKFEFERYSDFVNEKKIEFPTECPNDARNCKSRQFSIVENSTEMIDFQEIYLQSQVQKLGIGKIPRVINCKLKCDLTDQCQAGDDVTIVGFVRNHWQSSYIHRSKQNLRWEVTMYIECLSLYTDADTADMNNNSNHHKASSANTNNNNSNRNSNNSKSKYMQHK
jgi:DNA replicative helicase MCM subunit Mcm2 (Cdc46/Mcm family)